MSKLCSLKEITPGSVIKLPRAYGLNALGVMAGMEYSADQKMILPAIFNVSGEEVIPTSLPDQVNTTEFELVEDKKLQTLVADAFLAAEFPLPSKSMSSGCDPEIFVEHGDGSIFPAWEFLPDEETSRLQAKRWLLERHPRGESEVEGASWGVVDSNNSPLKVPIYWDGAQAEFAPWAKNCLETLHDGTRIGLKTILAFAQKKDPQAKLTIKNTIELPDSVLKNADDKHIQFRCSRSYNIYDDPGDGIPDARQYKYRCAGGHIHLGFTRGFTAPAIEQIVRALDGVLGVVGVSLAAEIDNPERRRTYGRAGEFRLPSHGIEYRVLSNFWLCHPAITMLVFDLARATVRFAESGLYNLCWLADEKEVRDIINSCDVQGARKLIKKNLAPLTRIVKSMWGINSPSAIDAGAKKALLAFENGLESVIPYPHDIAGNWQFDKNWLSHCRNVDASWLHLTSVRNG